MCNGKGCVVSLVCKFLLIIGGLNWGVFGLGMLMGKGADWNVVHMTLNSVPTVEAVVYLLVGVAALMKLFGCRCPKCKMACASCDASGKTI